MKYEMKWVLKDGTKVEGQIYTAEMISSILKQLEEWGATDIELKLMKGKEQ